MAERAIKIVRDTNSLLPLKGKLAVVTVSPHGDPIAEVQSNATPEDAEVLLLLLAVRPKSGAGTISVPEDIRELAQRHAQKTVAVSFGSPYIIRELGDVSTFVCAWGPQPVLQRAAMRALQHGKAG